MAIRLAIGSSEKGYLATDADVLIEAFEGALKKLGLVDSSDPAVRAVANHIITFATAGERDPVRLQDLTLEAVRR
jgi:crotonobetainyl-CoA:carnitine CoA-transferase CaiB-like acyl-CoA transferase